MDSCQCPGCEQPTFEVTIRRLPRTWLERVADLPAEVESIRSPVCKDHDRFLYKHPEAVKFLPESYSKAGPWQKARMEMMAIEDARVFGALDNLAKHGFGV